MMIKKLLINLLIFCFSQIFFNTPSFACSGEKYNGQECEFITACYEGDSDKIENMELNTEEFHCCRENEIGKITGLHAATINGNEEIVEILIKKSEEIGKSEEYINEQTYIDGFEDGYTALALAIRYNHKNIFKLLMAKGAYLRNKRPKYYFRPADFHKYPVMQAVKFQRLDIFKELCHSSDSALGLYEEKAKREAMKIALQREHGDILDFLIKRFLQANLPLHKRGYDTYEIKKDLLFLVTEYNYPNCVEDLLKNYSTDPNVSSGNKDGYNTPLHVAAKKGYIEIVNILLECGANPNKTSLNRETPLHKAAANGHTEVVKILLESRANPNQINLKENTPLHIAAANGHTEIVKLFLECNVNPNQTNCYRNTPLHSAAFSGHTEVVTLLLKYNANPNKKDRNGNTPLHAATSGRCTEVVKLLLENNANPNEKNISKKTPLYAAVFDQRPECVELLINHPTINIETICTELRIAVFLSYVEIIELIVDRLIQMDVFLGIHEKTKDRPILNSVMSLFWLANDNEEEIQECVDITKILIKHPEIRLRKEDVKKIPKNCPEDLKAKLLETAI